MNRKQFLSACIAVGALDRASAVLPDDGTAGVTVPEYLVRGDTIGITSPAGYITHEEIQPAILQMESWGMKVQVGTTIGQRHFSFGGADNERVQDFQQMLDDRSVKAIMCARGGYGAVRIIDKLNFTTYAAYPKWIIGFSDITIFHSHVNRNHGIATIHSKMCNSFPADWSKAEPVQAETILSIRDALTGKKMKYNAVPHTHNKTGRAEGILAGGNLKTIESLSGTQSDLVTSGKILFVEDTGEYLYSIDRMFWNLKRTGKLSKLKALIIGGFKIKPDNPGEEFGKTLYEIVLEKVKEYDYPVCFDFPVGHQVNNYALKCGVQHTLAVNAGSATLEEY